MTGLSAKTAAFVLVMAWMVAWPGVTMAHDSPEHNCATPGHWVDPATGDLLAHDRLIDAAAGRAVVMLGENHPNVEHHRWQLSMLGALHGRRPGMVLGFEAFPRAVQPVLDRWVAGELAEDAFLRAADWSRNWGFDPALYLPMFHFARLYRVPMVALNIERALVERIRDEGLAAMPEEERRGLSEPASPSDAYLDDLALVFSQHLDQGDTPAADQAEDEAAELGDIGTEGGGGGHGGAVPGAAIRDDPRFKRFVRVQTTWDRAMAEALAEAARRPGAPLVVGVLGSGHLEKGYGVPHQLADLGVTETAIFLPVPPAESCEAYRDETADALFILPDEIPVASVPSGPRLGVMIEAADDRVVVMQVGGGSVAAAADLRDGDAILRAAGVTISDAAELIGIVQQQAPGTWLPLEIERGGATLDIVAKFPALPEDHTQP